MTAVGHIEMPQRELTERELTERELTGSPETGNPTHDMYDQPIRRFLSHSVIIDGTEHSGLTVTTVHPDRSVSTEPYSAETCGTVFVNGCMTVETRDGRVTTVQSGQRILLNFSDK